MSVKVESDITEANAQYRRQLSQTTFTGTTVRASPAVLLNGKRKHSRSLDQLHLDRMSSKEPADTEVLQKQLQHLTLQGEHEIKISTT
ncbi:UNC119-binding protein C5orf30-like [Arapaima gigas]